MEVCLEGRWHTPCHETWGIEETQVVCRQLEFCQQGGTCKIISIVISQLKVELKAALN